MRSGLFFFLVLFCFCSGVVFHGKFYSSQTELLLESNDKVRSVYEDIVKHQMSASKDMVGSIKKTNLFIYPAKVSNVVDGDTLDVSIQIWNDITIFKRVRLLGVDTPELHPREGTSSEKILEVENAKKSKEFTIQSTTGKMIYFATNGLVDSFGRSLGNIVWEDGGKAYNLGDELMKAGLAKNFKK